MPSFDELAATPEDAPMPQPGRKPLPTSVEVKAPTSGPFAPKQLMFDDLAATPEEKPEVIKFDDLAAMPEEQPGLHIFAGEQFDAPPGMEDIAQKYEDDKAAYPEMIRLSNETAAKQRVFAEDIAGRKQPGFLDKASSMLKSGAQKAEDFLKMRDTALEQGANTIKNEYTTPAIRKVQETLKPVGDLAIKNLKSGPFKGPLAADIEPADEALLRQGMSTAFGPGIISDQPQGQDALVQKYGPEAAQNLTMVADAAGMGITLGPAFIAMPSLAVRSGLAAEAAVASRIPAAIRTAAPITTKLAEWTAKGWGAVAGGTVEGAAFSAAAPGSGDIKEDVAAGGKMGGSLAALLHMGGGALTVGNVLKNTYTHIGKMNKEARVTLANEAANYHNVVDATYDPKSNTWRTQPGGPVDLAVAPKPVVKPEGQKLDPFMGLKDARWREKTKSPRVRGAKADVTPGEKSQALAVQSAKEHQSMSKQIPAREITPSIATLMVDNTGALVGRLSEIGPDGVVAWSDMPLKETLDFVKFNKKVRDFGISWDTATPAIPHVGQLNFEALQALNSQDPYTWAERVAESDLRNDVKTALEDELRYQSQPKTYNNRLPKPTLEAAPIQLVDEVSFGTQDGRLKISDSELTTPTNIEMGLADTRISNTKPSSPRVTETLASLQTLPGNLPQGGAGGKGNTREIRNIYATLKKAEANKVKAPKEYVEALNKWQEAIAPKPAHIADITPQEVPKVPMPGPGELPDHALDEINDTVRLIRQLIKEDSKYRTVGGKVTQRKGLLGWFANDNVRGPENLRHWINSMHGAKAIASPAEKAKIMESVRQGLPAKKMFDAAANDLDKVFSGRVPMAVFEKHHPDVSADMKNYTSALMKEANANSKELTELGLVPEDLSVLRDLGIIDQYRAKVYKAHYLGKGGWAKVVPDNVLQDGIHYLQNQHPNWDNAQVAAEVMSIIRADDPRARYLQSSLNKASGNLKERQTFAPEVEALLGLEKSGPVKMAVTLAHQRSLLRQIKIWNEIATDPRYFSPTAKPGFVPVEAVKGKFGNAANGYVSEDLIPLMDVTNAPDLGFQMSHMLGAWVKRNQVLLGGPVPWANNIMRNIIPSYMAGGLLPWKPVQAMQDMTQAMALRKAWNKNPVKGSAGELFHEAQSLGALPANQARVEMGFGTDKMLDLVADAMGTSQDLYSGLTKLRKVAEKLTPEQLGEMYEAIDTNFKFANYLALRRKFLKQGMTPEQAGRTATDRINQSFINFEHTGRLAKEARSTPFGSLAPYLTSAVEEIRIKGLLTKRLLEEPDLRGRVLAAGALFAGAGASLWALRNLNGISDEEVAESFAVRKNSGRQWRPGSIALPWRDADGRVQHMDFGGPIPELNLAQGDPTDPLFTRIASNIVKTPINGSVYENMFDYAASRSGILTEKPPQKPRDLDAERGTLDAIAPFFKQSGVVPGVVSSGMETLRKGGVIGELGPNEEARTPGQTLWNSLGLPNITPVSTPSAGERSPSWEGKKQEYDIKIRRLMQQRNSIIYSKRAHDEKQKLLRITDQLIRELREKRREDRSTINEATPPR